MQPDLWSLYRDMYRSRAFEQAVARLWYQGEISGEMHLGIGEEAIVAGLVAHIQEGDAMALDHRGTPPLIMRGIDPLLLLREFLGGADGLCGGRGGHMHLFSPEHLIASSGIVGAAGPAAAGFALANRLLRPRRLAVAFFGEGAMNQGMLLESLNLAAAWKLPVIFICKDNGWAITTPSSRVTGGSLSARARGFGMPAAELDGSDVEAVWQWAREAAKRARGGRGPSFLHAYCLHVEGHFLEDPLVKIARHPVGEMKERVGPLIKSMIEPQGASLAQRSGSLGTLASLLGKTAKDHFLAGKDPLKRARARLRTSPAALKEAEEEIDRHIQGIVEEALGPGEGKEAHP